MKRSAIQRRTPLNRGTSQLRRTRLASVSPSKLEPLARYRAERAEHFKEHPRCQYPLGCTRSLLKGDLMDLHHKAGRNGPLLYCRRYFATACREHHDLAKTRISHSRSIGWIVDVSSEEVRQLRLQDT